LNLVEITSIPVDEHSPLGRQFDKRCLSTPFPPSSLTMPQDRLYQKTVCNCQSLGVPVENILYEMNIFPHAPIEVKV